MRYRLGLQEPLGWFAGLGPPLLVLCLTMLLSLHLGEFTFLKGWESIYRGAIRFGRIALTLCLPLLLLPSVCEALGRILRKGTGTLVSVEGQVDSTIHTLKHSLLRPFQGIGIGLFFGTKLVFVLQIAGGQKSAASLLLPQGHFQLGRLMAVTGITILVSLLLSTVWTLADLGVRYYNRKRKELRMIGNFVQTIMPAAFGFYGVFSLYSEFSIGTSLFYLFQIVVILYPPFAVFSVVHARFVRSRMGAISRRIGVVDGGLARDGGGSGQIRFNGIQAILPRENIPNVPAEKKRHPEAP